MVHHYTTENHHLPRILASGMLIPNNVGAEHEPPLLWFSNAQHWESTATKMVHSEHGPRLLTFAEQLAQYGCVRFSLASDDPRLMNWVDACKYAGITSTVRRKLEIVGRKRDGSHIDWFAIAGSVSLTELKLERFDGSQWVGHQPD
ncbi:hypothetical protein [Pseudomonas gingeri]|uniref:Uncharacterized protein n=1 Tax=Pseudomonas gingeri TaxID=117681 RepID=A0A7Y7WHP3_9PSED|nr:hypothetical protein [Pseudomonas gingeri]NWB49547.1 hypothetical protein [Pseudomonas gingeri]